MSRTARQLPLPLISEHGFSIDNLVVTKANEAVFAALENWPHWRNPVTVLHGAKQSGKSHMAACWAAQALAHEFPPHRLQAATEVAATGTPILLDEIEPETLDETALFHLINAVREARIAFHHAALLLTSRTHPTAWKIDLPDLASRLRAVQILEMPPPDDLLLAAVMTKLFADRQIMVEPQVIRYSVSRIERSLATVVDFVAALDHAALERKSKITLKLAAEILGSISN